MVTTVTSTLLACVLLPSHPGRADTDAVSVTPARKDGDGFLVHEVRSPYQAGTTLVRVLVPDGPAKDRKYPVVYVLPVEAGTESRYGDGLAEVKKLDLHNKLNAVFAAPVSPTCLGTPTTRRRRTSARSRTSSTSSCRSSSGRTR